MHVNISHIANLAKLHIADSELPKFQHDMGAIIAMVENLPDVKNYDMLDARHPMDLREDVITADPLERDLLLQNAPEVQAGCVVVPKTVQQ